jgi:hypothetical protein
MRNARNIFLALLVALPATGFGKSPELLGEWVINHELTDAIAPEFKDANLFSGMGNGRVSVSVMGIPIPRAETQPAAPSGALKDPDVLSCNEMRIEHIGDELQLTYKGVGTEVLKQGDYRGRQTRWTARSISQRYESTSRKVTKEWELRRDGRLLVTVEINPTKDKKRTYKRVFERPSTGLGNEAADPAS